MVQTVGAGSLAQEAGVPIRTIQFWTDAGVLIAEPESDRQGRGRHRIYRAEPLFGERACALVAAEMHRMKIPVGIMREVVELLVRWRKPPPREGTTIPGEALAGRQIALVVSIIDDDPKRPLTERYGVTILAKEIDPTIRSGYLLNLTEILRPLREAP
jgi:hypothetical protein